MKYNFNLAIGQSYFVAIEGDKIQARKNALRAGYLYNKKNVNKREYSYTIRENAIQVQRVA